MRASITYQVEVDSVQKLTALRDRLGVELEADEDVGLTASASAVEDHPFIVVGAVRGRPDEAWREIVMAQDAQEAAAKVLAADETRTVVAVDGELIVRPSREEALR